MEVPWRVCIDNALHFLTENKEEWILVFSIREPTGICELSAWFALARALEGAAVSNGLLPTECMVES